MGCHAGNHKIGIGNPLFLAALLLSVSFKVSRPVGGLTYSMIFDLLSQNSYDSFA